jgi:hypothetical protein
VQTLDGDLDEAMPDGALEVRAMFRDSHVGPDGAERVLHEYDLEAEIDLGLGDVTRCYARPMVLPWPECPQAARQRLSTSGAARGFVARRRAQQPARHQHLHPSQRPAAIRLGSRVAGPSTRHRLAGAGVTNGLVRARRSRSRTPFQPTGPNSPARHP